MHLFRHLVGLVLLFVSVSARGTWLKRQSGAIILGQACPSGSNATTVCGKNSRAHCALSMVPSPTSSPSSPTDQGQQEHEWICGGQGAVCSRYSKSCASGFYCTSDHTCQPKTKEQTNMLKASASPSARARRGLPKISKDAPW